VEFRGLRPFTFRMARMIGGQQFDAAIDDLSAGLKGNASDAASLEMIAQCHRWAGRNEEAITAGLAALLRDPASFAMHSMLAELFAEKGEHDDAAIHVRKGLECYPEPLEKIPRFISSAFKLMARLFPRLQGSSPENALQRIEASNAEWFEWATKYLVWYDATYGKNINPSKH
jgi:tetratricopeptide (TPR) repeat protein